MRFDKGAFEIYSHTLIIYTPLIDSIRPPPDAVFCAKAEWKMLLAATRRRRRVSPAKLCFCFMGKFMQGKLFLRK